MFWCVCVCIYSLKLQKHFQIIVKQIIRQNLRLEKLSNTENNERERESEIFSLWFRTVLE